MKHLILISLLLCIGGLCRGQKPFQPDTTINGKLVLENPPSVKRFCAASEIPAISENRIRPYPFSLFLNKGETQYLFAYCYEGSQQNRYSAFEVGYVDDIAPLEGIKYNVTPDSLFASETGIALGMDIKRLKSNKGPDFQVSDENGTWMVYRLDAQSEFCRKHNMPDYLLKVRTKDGRINRIWFGFEYP